ncbi:MAG: DUF2786 domain-containing protein [Kineosporiaceae bacterium]|nr:DUF2786 domain-containing protein [Kineosporiaceae bacterium]
MGVNNRQRRAARAKQRSRAAREYAARQGQRASGSSFPDDLFAFDDLGFDDVLDDVPPPAPVTLTQRADQLISEVLDILDVDQAGRMRYGAGPLDLRVAQRLDALSELAGSPTQRRDVERAVIATVDAGFELAWSQAWEPADLHRLVVRSARAEHVAVLHDLMARQLTRYATATLDPRWPGQLDELEARVWWPAGELPLSAAGLGPGWTARLGAALEVAHLLLRLPRIQRVGAAPGTATSRPEPERPQVDERILSRVRALLAKAESTPCAAEAETFTAGAQALMARHSIDTALLAAADAAAGGSTEEPVAQRIGIDAPYEQAKMLLLVVVAGPNRCRTAWSQPFGFATVVGHPGDLAAVETLFTSLLVQAMAALGREGSRSDRYGRSRTRAFRSSFLTSYAHRIGERLTEVASAETEAAAADVSRTGGRDLVPVLQHREEAVEAAFEALFPAGLRSRSLGSATDAEGWHSGRLAADRASLAMGPAVEG